ncbi:MAG TPA: Mu-like prophage major head subunit gpT family protein, partial [Actinomycetes bacterium]|nr:Mu-like prophage major head subunit gpT family protein [Actinomycetes bacterium]
MAFPHSSESFGDVLDPRFQKIVDDALEQVDDMIPTLYADAGTNGRDEMKWSEIGTVPDFQAFAGTVQYNSVEQGYDVTATPLEFTNGIQITRKLFDDDQYQIMDRRPRGLANSAMRTRQQHAARIFNIGFSIDNMFYAHTENVALCSDSHTTNAPDVSTAVGFDNLGTAPLTAVAVNAARIQMRGFRGDQGEIISIMPDELWVPIDLQEQAWEIIESSGKLDTANNNANFHRGTYTLYDWE